MCKSGRYKHFALSIFVICLYLCYFSPCYICQGRYQCSNQNHKSLWWGLRTHLCHSKIWKLYDWNWKPPSRSDFFLLFCCCGCGCFSFLFFSFLFVFVFVFFFIFFFFTSRRESSRLKNVGYFCIDQQQCIGNGFQG